MVMTTATRSSGQVPEKAEASASATGNVAGLLAQVSEGNSAAWEEIVRRYGTLVSATVRSFRLQDADALDAIQTTWLRLAENTHRIRYPDRLSSWLITTARHECLRILHRTTSTPDPIETVADTLADPASGPEQHTLDTDAARTLWTLVEELPPRQRTLLHALFTDDPQPYTDLARTAGIPTGAIGPTRKRALRQLRDKLTERGLGQRPREERCRVHTVRGAVARDTTQLRPTG
jgi:RNA polymerase sigma factor (sigma-70 family)